MKIFIDSADINEIKEAAALGLLDGITKQLDPSMDTMEIVAHYAE